MSDFAALADDFLAADLAAHPAMATLLGADGHDGELPDLSAAGIAARADREREWAAAFGALDSAGLTAAEEIDRDLVLLSLRRRVLDREWGTWRRDAESYLDPLLLGLVTLFLHPSRPEPQRVADALARLAGLPDLLAAARANLDPCLASPLLLDRAVGHARGAVTYLRHWLPREVGQRSPPLAAAAERAADLVEAHVRWLAELSGRAGGDWAIGDQRYTARLQEVEGLGMSAAELHHIGETSYPELVGDIGALTRRLDGSDNWRSTLGRMLDDAPSTLADMQAEYAEWTARARAFCAERDLVTLPAEERCEVVPSPPHERAVTAVAFYYQPPLLARGLVGHFFVPFTPDGTPAMQVRQRLQSNSRMTIPTTSVHEAYPGHHWHLAWLSATSERPLRAVLGSAYFVEGWALYAEQMMREQGFFTDLRHEIGQVEARMFRAARIIVDTALHCGEMTVEEAVGFLQDSVAMSAETARAEVVRYCAWPTQASSYLTGALEIQRLRDEWVAAGGGLREFHDRIAGSGMLPLGLAARALYGSD